MSDDIYTPELKLTPAKPNKIKSKWPFHNTSNICYESFIKNLTEKEKDKLWKIISLRRILK